MITLRQILDHMHAGRTFSCVCVAYDAQRKRGGSLIRIDEGQLVMPTAPATAHLTPQQLVEHYKALALAESEPQPPADRRNPNHRLHFTRNVRILHQGQPTTTIVKVHPTLIIEFNGDTDVVP